MKIKFAIASDNTSQPSYYCKDNKFFELEGDRDVTHEDMAYSGFWNYPALFNGNFINLKKEIYPDEKFDLIFAGVECNKDYLDTLKTLFRQLLL